MRKSHILWQIRRDIQERLKDKDVCIDGIPTWSNTAWAFTVTLSSRVHWSKDDPWEGAGPLPVGAPIKKVRKYKIIKRYHQWIPNINTRKESRWRKDKFMKDRNSQKRIKEYENLYEGAIWYGTVSLCVC